MICFGDSIFLFDVSSSLIEIMVLVLFWCLYFSTFLGCFCCPSLCLLPLPRLYFAAHYSIVFWYGISFSAISLEPFYLIAVFCLFRTRPLFGFRNLFHHCRQLYHPLCGIQTSCVCFPLWPLHAHLLIDASLPVSLWWNGFAVWSYNLILFFLHFFSLFACRLHLAFDRRSDSAFRPVIPRIILRLDRSGFCYGTSGDIGLFLRRFGCIRHGLWIM